MHRTLPCFSVVRKVAVDPLQMHRWTSCELAKILVNEAALSQATQVRYPIGPVLLPNYLAYGMGNADSQKIFSTLPGLSAQRELFASSSNPQSLLKLENSVNEAELLKANLFARAVDLRNADADGIAYENRRRIILAFSSPENPFDTGRTEVQGAPAILYALNCSNRSEQPLF